MSLEHDIRPISITSSVAKITESFISRFFNEHFQSFIDKNQFGCTKNRSTCLALIKLSEMLFSNADSSNVFIRILFVDFRKAFDLVDTNVLFNKFQEYSFPDHITAWHLSFLHERFQYVKIGNNVSDIRQSHAGAPQGTRCGPDDFKLLINDLDFQNPYLKYVDDTTVVTVSGDPLDEGMQVEADHLIGWCKPNGMQLNEEKTKEMVIHFGKINDVSSVPLLVINGSCIQRVDSFKLLGVVFNSRLTWSDHVQYILSKVSKRIFIIHHLVRIGIVSRDIVTVYCAMIRSVLEYCCSVWHSGLTKSESMDIERVQRRVLRIIFPALSYSDALSAAGITRLETRRENIVRECFQEMKCPDHFLHHLVPVNDRLRETRDTYPFKLPRTRTLRGSQSFINHCIRKRY